MLGEEKLPVVDGLEGGYDFLTSAALQHPQYLPGCLCESFEGFTRGCDRVLAGKLGTIIGGSLGCSPVPSVVTWGPLRDL